MSAAGFSRAAWWSSLLMLCAPASAITGDETAPPIMHVVPARVFTVVVDGFKQVTSASVACGTLPGEIASIAAYPSLPAGENFSFDAVDKALVLRMKRNTGKKPVEAGKFSWDGALLTWTWNTFPAVDVGGGMKQLRNYFSSSAFVATLTDGRVLVLCPPPSELALSVTMQTDGILLGSVETTTVAADAIVTVERISGATWITTSAEAGGATGTLDGHAFVVMLAGGKCTVMQRSPRLLEMRELTTQLVENKKLAPSLPDAQRRILEQENAATTLKIAALKEQVESERLPTLTAVLRIRATDAASSRVYAIVTTIIGN